MSRAERPTFGASDVIEIASKFEADDGAFVIGGQATNLWAWFFRDKDRSLLLQEPLTSEDIDYFGTYEIAKNIAAALGGEVLRPAPDDHSPSTAQIVATFHGKRLKIDFLGSVLGVKERELRRGVSVLEVGGEIDGVSTVVLIKVLHPVLCLKTRIINMLNPLTRRTDRIARRQAEAAFVIVRCFIEDALNAADGWRDAKDCFAMLYWYVRSDEFVRVADLKLGLDVLDIIRCFTEDARIDPRYRERQLKKMIANIERKRATRKQTGDSR